MESELRAPNYTVADVYNDASQPPEYGPMTFIADVRMNKNGAPESVVWRENPEGPAVVEVQFITHRKVRLSGANRVAFYGEKFWLSEGEAAMMVDRGFALEVGRKAGGDEPAPAAFEPSPTPEASPGKPPQPAATPRRGRPRKNA